MLSMYSVHRQIMQADHAIRMDSVFRELTARVYRYDSDCCYNCDNPVENNKYIHSIYDDVWIYCSEWCMYQSVYDIRKQMKRAMRNKKSGV